MAASSSKAHSSQRRRSSFATIRHTIKGALTPKRDIAHLTEEQVIQYREAFRIFDRDGTGTISRSELSRAIRALGQNTTDKELDAMISEVDHDGNGQLDFPEFCTYAEDQSPATCMPT